MVIMDNDLKSIQQAREFSRKARAAYEEYSTFPQNKVDKIVEAMAGAGIKASQRLAKLAVEETGYGILDDKIAKNLFAVKNVFNSIKDLKTVGVISRDDDRKIIEIAHPMGVVAAITPTTNPTSTVMFKSLICAKSRNAVIFMPHPRAVECSREAALVMKEAAENAGAPKDLILCMDTVTLEGSKELMADNNIAIILATGGLGMVKAAHSFGKPAIGVGPGNVPVYIDRSADFEKAAKDIIASKSFDNGVICSSEQAIIVHSGIEDSFNKALKKAGGYFLSPEEAKKVGNVLVKGNSMDPEMVGKSPKFIGDAAGVAIPDKVRLLIAPTDGVGPDHPLSREILSPIVAYYTCKDWLDGCNICVEILNFGGLGHTLVIHSRDPEIITSFAHEKPVFRILVNTTSSQGAIGLSTSLTPSMTLSTGSWGGGIHSDNISAQHLLNIKRVAYETDPINEPAPDVIDLGIGDSNRNNSSEVMRGQIEQIVRRVINKLDLNDL
jgi:acetaldehyde dehydrogenase (acetylating)